MSEFLSHCKDIKKYLALEIQIYKFLSHYKYTYSYSYNCLCFEH